MLATLKLRFCTVQETREFARVAHMAIELELSSNAKSILPPCITTDVPVERVTKIPPVQVHHVLLVQLAERWWRTCQPYCRRKHLLRLGVSCLNQRERESFSTLSNDDALRRSFACPTSLRPPSTLLGAESYTPPTRSPPMDHVMQYASGSVTGGSEHRH